MSPSEIPEAICKSTEPHRKQIGWLSILTGIVIAVMLAGIASLDHHNAQQERLKTAKHQVNLSRLEDSIRDLMLGSDRPFIVIHAGEHGPGDEHVISWTPAATRLLGWTLEDIQEGGLGIMIPKEYKVDHDKQMEIALHRPVGERKTAVMHYDAIHKDGHRVPVRITAWVVGDHTRSIAGYIDPESNVVETSSYITREPM